MTSPQDVFCSTPSMDTRYKMTSQQVVPRDSNAGLAPGPGALPASYPDAYRLAIALARSFAANTIIDIGFAAPGELMAGAEFRWIIVDRDLHPTTRHIYFPNETWIDWDWPPDRDIPITDENLKGAIVVCAGVIADVRDSTGLLAFLRRASRHASAIIVCAPERGLRGENCAEQQSCTRQGPLLAELPQNLRQPENRSGGWHLPEFKALLEQNDLHPTFIGLTVDDDESLQKNSIIAIIDGCPLAKARLSCGDFRPLALTSTFNDADIALEIVQKLLDDGIEVIVHDNWSDDGTYEQLAALASTRDDLSVVRFPESGPSKCFEWTALLHLKEKIAATFPGRWIIHHDSDEIRCSPWPDLSLRQGLYLVDLMGFSAVEFTVCGFRPVDDRFAPGRNLERHIHHFEFSTDRADFIQAKAWRQTAKPVDLVHMAGHDAYFPGRRVFPYKFLLKHYPLRSPAQARRKIFVERRPRFAPEEREAGWHYHYDGFDENDSFVWNAAELIDYEAPATRSRFLMEIISGIGIVRDKHTARAVMPIGSGAKSHFPSRRDLASSVAAGPAHRDEVDELPRTDLGATQRQIAVLTAVAAAADRFREDAHLSGNNSRENLKRLEDELRTEREQVVALKDAIEDRDLQLEVADRDLRRLIAEIEDRERRLRAADGDLRRLIAEIEDRDRRLRAADGDLHRLIGEVDDRDRQLGAADAGLRRLTGEVRDRDRQIEAADGDLRRLIGEVEDRNRRMEAADRDLRRLTGEVEDRNRQLILARQAVDGLTEDVRNGERRLMALARQLHAIETSTIWRATAPIRRLFSGWRRALFRPKT
jgi:Glycosyl transferase family 2